MSYTDNQILLIKKICCKKHNFNEDNIEMSYPILLENGDIKVRILEMKVGFVPLVIYIEFAIIDILMFCIEHTDALCVGDTNMKYCKVCRYPMIKLSSQNIAYCGSCRKEYSWKLDENELPLICGSRVKSPKG